MICRFHGGTKAAAPVPCRLPGTWHRRSQRPPRAPVQPPSLHARERGAASPPCGGHREAPGSPEALGGQGRTRVGNQLQLQALAPSTRLPERETGHDASSVGKDPWPLGCLDLVPSVALAGGSHRGWGSAQEAAPPWSPQPGSYRRGTGPGRVARDAGPTSAPPLGAREAKCSNSHVTRN